MTPNERQGITRRGFLKATAGAAVAIGAARDGTAADALAGRRMRIGVVSDGRGGALPWHRHPNGVVAGVCGLADAADARPSMGGKVLDHLSRAYECPKQYESLDRMLADGNIDAIAVFAPLSLRAAVACKAMEAGKHVVSASPAAVTLEEARRLVETHRRTGRVYVLADLGAYCAEAMLARQWYRDGRFGEIVCSEFDLFCEGADAWSSRAAAEPPMPLVPAVLTAVTGERLVGVSAYGWPEPGGARQTTRRGGAGWGAVAEFRTDRGHTTRIRWRWGTGRAAPDGGSLTGERLRLQWPTDAGGSSRADSQQAVVNDFMAATLDGRPPVLGADAVVAMAAANLAAGRSIMRSGQAETVLT